MAENKEPWHLDKRVPIATLTVLIVQGVLGVAWVTSLSNRANGNAQRLNVVETRMEGMRSEANTQAVQLGRIEESISGVRTDISRLIATVERGR